jgi:phage anti-repressor protein
MIDPRLIPVTQAIIGGNEVQAVQARDLHAGLGAKKDFTNWVKQQIERLRLVSGRDYQLETGLEGVVYAPEGEVPNGRRPSVYWFTLDAAKHIAMMANTDRGFAVREHFIDCERRLLTPQAPASITEKPWRERSLEDRSMDIRTANAIGRYGNNAMAWWYLAEEAKIARFPKHLLPAWHQSALDLEGFIMPEKFEGRPN